MRTRNGARPAVPEAGPGALGPRSLDRALKALDLLAHRRDGETLATLSRQFRAPKSSVLNLLRAMTHRGYLLQGEDGRYRIGPAAFSLAMAILSNRELPEFARPFMEELAEQSGETVLLGTLASDAPVAIYIDKVESRNPIRYTVSLGERRPLYCSTIGKLLLAHASPAFQEQYLGTVELRRHTPRTVTDRNALREELRAIRRTGLSSTVDEMFVGASAVAAPVLSRDGRIVAGLVVAGPTSRLVPQRRRLSDLVRRTARTLSGLIGFGRPVEPAAAARDGEAAGGASR